MRRSLIAHPSYRYRLRARCCKPRATKKVTSDGVNRGLYTFDESSEVPHAMIHWREFENDEARAQVRALTLDFLEKGNALTS